MFYNKFLSCMSFFDVLINPYFISFCFFVLAFLILMPCIYKCFTDWRRTKKSRDFASAIFLGWICLYLLTPSFLLLLHAVGEFKTTASAEYYRTLSLFLIALGCFSLSGMAIFLKQLQEKNNVKNFILMMFFCIISIYCLSINWVFLMKTLMLKYD